MSRLQYLSRSALRSFVPSRSVCLNCGGNGALVTRKYFFTALRRCGSCKVMYRTPTDSQVESEKYYNEAYVQGETTSLPSLARLEAMKANLFSEMECNYNFFADVLKALGAPAGGKVFDYGCSWGYGSYIFRQAGFEVSSFEISKPRGQFGQKHLGINLIDNFEDFVASNTGEFDAFFSSHVLEHVPSPSRIINNGLRLVKPGGLFVSFFPNGCESYRKKDYSAWMKMWGEVHPNFLDDLYINSLLKDHAHIVGTTPFDISSEALEHLSSGNGGQLQLNEPNGNELFVAARKSAF